MKVIFPPLNTGHVTTFLFWRYAGCYGCIVFPADAEAYTVTLYCELLLYREQCLAGCYCSFFVPEYGCTRISVVCHLDHLFLVCRLSPSQSPRTSNPSPVTNTLTQLALPSHTQVFSFFFLVACPHTHQAACVRAALEAVATGAPVTERVPCLCGKFPRL